MSSGIYAIVNKVNGNTYVGSSRAIESRWQRHIALLNRNSHHSPHLQRAWNKYGAEKFDFVVLMECDTETLIDNEQKHIDVIAPTYNVSPTAGSVAGVIRSEEYRQKQSVSQRGKVIPQDTRARISEGMRGKKNSLGTHRKVSADVRDKIRNKLIGHPVSEETRAKISAKNKGFKHTDESKKKIGRASIGNKYNLGRIQSKEERAKRGLAQKAAWERRKQKMASNAEC